MKKKIFIDLNDVFREFSKQYIIYFNKSGIDKNFNPDKIKYVGGDMYSPFNFPSKKSKEDFEREEFVFEIFGCAKSTHTSLPGHFNVWLNDIMDEFEDQVEIWFISPYEVHLQRQATLLFLTKTCSRVSHIWFPKNLKEIWNQCDILITANPMLLEKTPKGKTTIKINTKYNKKSKSTYSYEGLMNFIMDENQEKIKEIIKT